MFDIETAEIRNKYTRDELLEIMIEERISRPLEGFQIASLFWEPSTRTRLSFSCAAKGLGAGVVGFSAGANSSFAKGETVLDTIKNLQTYVEIDAIVMRHFIEGSARLAAESTNLPVINAGDGANEHPTQTMLDLYTIRKEIGRLDDLKIGIAGDLKLGRTVHSLIVAFYKFRNITFFLCSPDQLQLPPDYKDEMKKKKILFYETNKLEDILGEMDVLYMTRIQRERFVAGADGDMEYKKVQGVVRLTKQMLRKKDHVAVLHPEIIPENVDSMGFDDYDSFYNFCMLHPLPRIDEIEVEVDSLPNAAYFRQAGNGIPIRKALLYLTMGVNN